ncbi:hypothetical protein [Okeania sp. SIO1I7]|uniref:hypothetical protein n=1 Tax=Okeania sp. SIO1I7 TaxID=2607772 RepID=UPI0013FBA98C|nr:hypothetical protein [Okeania sp. SIO1I7]NET25866.1 hypothetical protein [Okeania sp. SIO1I7]
MICSTNGTMTMTRRGSFGEGWQNIGFSGNFGIIAIANLFLLTFQLYRYNLLKFLIIGRW